MQALSLHDIIIDCKLARFILKMANYETELGQCIQSLTIMWPEILQTPVLPACLSSVI